MGQGVSLDQAKRDRLRNLTLKFSDRVVSEGDVVEVVGYVTGLPYRQRLAGLNR